MQPKAIFPKKTTDTFMAQFETIANGPLEMKDDGSLVAGSVDISLGKLGSTNSTDCTMSDITNQ